MKKDLVVNIDTRGLEKLLPLLKQLKELLVEICDLETSLFGQQ